MNNKDKKTVYPTQTLPFNEWMQYIQAELTKMQKTQHKHYEKVTTPTKKTERIS